jgi:glycosyltransferase involved in cell wall biosynthesis
MNGGRRRLLAISHPAVVSVNQEVYRELARRGRDVTIVVPRRWRHSYSRTPIAPRALAGLEHALRPLPVAFRGRPQRHLYLTSARTQSRRSRPAVAFIEAEPYSLAATQWGRALARAGVPFGVQCYENIDRPLPAAIRRLRARVLRDAAFVAARSDSAAQLVRAWGARGEVGLAPPAVPPWESARAVPTVNAQAVLAPNTRTAPAMTTPAAAVNTQTAPAMTTPAAAMNTQTAPTMTTPAAAMNTQTAPTLSTPADDLGGRRAAFTVGYAGRLVESKGLIDLVEAVRMLDPPVELLLVGNGELRHRLHDQPIPGGRVRVLDGVAHEQMSCAYARFDVLALPSHTTPTWKEQFGRVIVEALWCGVPVVGSDSGEIPWLIELTGGGQVFPEGDRDALAARLRALRDAPELRAELAGRGRAAVERMFSVAAATDAFEGLLVRAAGDPLTREGGSRGPRPRA